MSAKLQERAAEIAEMTAVADEMLASHSTAPQWQVDHFDMDNATGWKIGMIVDVNLNGNRSRVSVKRIEAIKAGGVRVHLVAA